MGEITKEEIQDRVHGLAVNVQDPKRHTSFVPGQIWWLASANKNYVGREVTFWEQIDVSLKDIGTGRESRSGMEGSRRKEHQALVLPPFP